MYQKLCKVSLLKLKLELLTTQVLKFGTIDPMIIDVTFGHWAVSFMNFAL